jgi:hypothetical protein
MRETKYFKIDFHLIREKLHVGMKKLPSAISNDQLADFFTKPLFPQNTLLLKL